MKHVQEPFPSKDGYNRQQWQSCAENNTICFEVLDRLYCDNIWLLHWFSWSINQVMTKKMYFPHTKQAADFSIISTTCSFTPHMEGVVYYQHKYLQGPTYYFELQPCFLAQWLNNDHMLYHMILVCMNTKIFSHFCSNSQSHMIVPCYIIIQKSLATTILCYADPVLGQPSLLECPSRKSGN